MMELGSRGLAGPAETRSFLHDRPYRRPPSPLHHLARPGASPEPKQTPQKGQLVLIERQSAVKMSFIQKRGLSTLIPPKVRLQARISQTIAC
jgi:hypothetical protein